MRSGSADLASWQLLAGDPQNVSFNVYRGGTKLNASTSYLNGGAAAGAHYIQFQVYDYNGGGKAEVAMKTADATRDGRGTVIGDANADHRNSSGYILTGPEFLTVFNGQTGAAMSTTMRRSRTR